MSIRTAVKITEKYIINNSPTLLSAVAATGAMTTAYLTGKATFRAADIIAREESDQFTEIHPTGLTTKDKTKLVWKEYIPPAIALTGTVSCIVLASSISSSRLAAMAAAYKILEKHSTEYREKIIEKLGKGKEREVRDEISADRVAANPLPRIGGTSSPLMDHEVWCLDAHTQRYFKSDMQTLRAAENELNRRIYLDMDASLSDFYHEIGLSSPPMASEIGWDIDNKLELSISTQLADGGIPCLVINFETIPSPIRHHRYP